MTTKPLFEKIGQKQKNMYLAQKRILNNNYCF